MLAQNTPKSTRAYRHDLPAKKIDDFAFQKEVEFDLVVAIRSLHPLWHPLFAGKAVGRKIGAGGIEQMQGVHDLIIWQVERLIEVEWSSRPLYPEDSAADLASHQEFETMSITTPKFVKAAAMTAPGTMEIREYPFPQIDRDSAILKIDMTGVCGTDKHIFKGEARELRGKSIYPYVGGHEIIGTIVEIGENAARTMDYDRQLLKVGDRVAVAVEVNCGACWYCRNHYNNTTCENQVMAYGLHPNADTAPHLRGGWSEYMYVMPGTDLFKIPEDLPTDVAVFVEELAVAYHSLARASGPFPAVKEGFGPGDSVAVLGNGPLGILHGVMASIHGAGSAHRHRYGRFATGKGQRTLRGCHHQRRAHDERGAHSASPRTDRRRRP